MDNLEKDLIRLKAEEVKIPKCVSNKINNAFEEIRKDNKKKNHFIKRKGIVAVAVVIIILGMTPSVRAAINDFVSSFKNPGIENAQMNNYIQPINDMSVATDKVDIKLNNIMVDKSKIILDYEMNFKGDDINLNLSENNLFYWNMSLCDENGNELYRQVYEEDENIKTENVNSSIFTGGEQKFEKDSIDSKKGHYRVMVTSNEATIPKISKLNIKINKIKIEQLKIDELLNWNSTVVLDDKFNNYKTIEYKWNNSENIKVYKAESVPTGISMEFLNSAKGRDAMDDVSNMKLLTESGEEYSLSGASVEENGDVDRYRMMFNGITSFQDVDKFTLEIKNPKLGTVDRVEFTK